jgi:peptidoglycan/LPS O-acetylase OafA/YrhL
MTSAHLVYRPHPRIGLRAGIAQILAVASVAICVFGVVKGWTLPATDAWMGLAVACLCYYGTIARPTFAVRFLSTRPLLALGAFSYSLYLIHNPVQQAMFWLKPAVFRGAVGDFCYLVATLPVIIGCAWLFSLLFERPFLSKKVKFETATEFMPVSLPLQTAASMPRRTVIHVPVTRPRTAGPALAVTE